MASNNLYSVRMRASRRGKHVSGAEKIVASENINLSLSELAVRALNKANPPDEIVLKIEDIGTRPIRMLKALDVITIKAADAVSGRMYASKVLSRAGVSDSAVKSAIDNLSNGPSASGGNMRGAMIMNAKTGERMEQDRERGIRATRFDWAGQAGKEIDGLLSGIGLVHFRTREALALATKVAYGPGVVAELCWSDDPEYAAGYVSSVKTGYVRFSNLKQLGNETGGRAIFINPEMTDIRPLIRYLEDSLILIDKAGLCRPAIEPDDYFECFK